MHLHVLNPGYALLEGTATRATSGFPGQQKRCMNTMGAPGHLPLLTFQQCAPLSTCPFTPPVFRAISSLCVTMEMGFYSWVILEVQILVLGHQARTSTHGCMARRATDITLFGIPV